MSDLPFRLINGELRQEHPLDEGPEITGPDYVPPTVDTPLVEELSGCLKETVRMVEAAHRQLGMYVDKNPRLEKARAALAKADARIDDLTIKAKPGPAYKVRQP